METRQWLDFQMQALRKHFCKRSDEEIHEKVNEGALSNALFLLSIIYR